MIEDQGESKEEFSFYVWGRGGDGQLGLGDFNDYKVPKRLEQFLGIKFKQAKCGGRHSVAVTEQGDCYTWGWNMSGQLGTGEIKDQQKPTLLKQISLLKALHGTEFESCDAGSDHTVFLTRSGAVYICGADNDGQQGNGGEGSQVVPKIVLGLHKEVIRQISCGAGHTLALTENGLVYSWGRGVNGRTGHGITDNVLKPKLIESIKNLRAVRVVCGWSHSLVQTSNCDVYSFGKGVDGILGHGDEVDQTLPKKIEFFDFFNEGKTISEIKCGYYHSAVLTSDHQVYTWGWGEFGQLGHNTSQNELIPRIVTEFEGKMVKSMSLGGFHSLAVCVDGTVYAWGGSQYGQLGVEDEKEMHLIPTKIDFFKELQVTKLEAGWWHSLAICGTEAKKQNLEESNPLNLSVLQEEFTLIEKEMEKIGEDNNNDNKNDSNNNNNNQQKEGEIHVEVIHDYDPTIPNQNNNKNNNNNANNGNNNNSALKNSGNNKNDPNDISYHKPVNITISSSGFGSRRDVIERKVEVTTENPKMNPFQKFSNWLSTVFTKESKSIGETSNVTESEDFQMRRQLVNQEKDEPIWREQILPNWKTLAKKEKLTEIVRKGIPVGVRGEAWSTFLEDKLDVTPNTFELCKEKAYEIRRVQSKDKEHHSVQRLIEVDLPRTFQKLSIFQKDGHFNNQLAEILEAYAVFNPVLGYAQGMTFLGGMLLLHMDSYNTFKCMCNLLDNHFFISFGTFNIGEILKHVKIYELLFSKHLPNLYKHFKSLGVSPEHYLLDWFFTMFCRALPFNICCRVWDSFMIEGEVFLFRTALAILKILENKLDCVDLDECVPILKKLPTDTKEEDLFSAIESITVPPYVHQFISRIIKPKTKSFSNTNKIEKNK